MGIFKRNNGPIYWYKFQFNGVQVVQSTKQCNDKVARSMEAAHRTSLAKGEVGIRDKKKVPTLAEFIDQRFEPWVKTTTTEKTSRDFYAVGFAALKRYKPIANAKLNEITSELAAAFAADRQANGGKRQLTVSTVNASTRVLRRVLKVSVEWEVIGRMPRVKTKPGENTRDHVVTKEEEVAYLQAASKCEGKDVHDLARPTLLSDVVGVLIETGLRPDENNRMDWDWVNWDNGNNGTFMVKCGKTKAARRQLFMTEPVRKILERRWIAAGKPTHGWVWPAPTKTGHIAPSGLKKQHRKALGVSKVRPFILYALRHTYLTRLGAQCGDPWKLARIAGHSSIVMSSRYVHPSEESVQAAMEDLGGHKTGYKPQKRQSRKKAA